MRDGVLRGTGEDETSPMKRMEMAVNGGVWKQIFPEDGIPDMRQERFAVPVGDLGTGEHVILVRVFDRAGNSGTGRISFSLP